MATSMEKSTSPPSLSTPADHTITSEEGPASFFCRQCQSAYKQPKILKCLHSFCSQCLQEVVEKTSDDSNSNAVVTCPLCACVTDVPPGGVMEMTSNSFLHRISNDYVNEVKHNLASKSLRDGSSVGTSRRNEPPKYSNDQEGQSAIAKSTTVTTGIKSAFHDESEQHIFTNLTDEQKSKTSRVKNNSSRSSSSSSSSAGGTSGDVVTRNEKAKTDAEPSSDASVHDAIQNMNRLQVKSMGLQGEALRVTYAIDHVNNHKEEWLQRREDLKRAIQRRSAQFQSLVKKMERNLISQIEDKSVEDKFHNSLDRGKTELRKNLKQVLHEVSVIKNVREMANYDEINELSSTLLGPSVGVGEVILDNIKYQFDLPTKPIEEMVRVGFGNLVTSHEQKSVYVPELKDYANLSMADITNVEVNSHAMAFKAGGILSAISGDSRIKTSGYRSASVVGRQVRRRGSDVGKTDAVLEEFQNARESLRNRRQEILRQGQSFRDSSPFRGGGGGGAVAAASARRVSRPTARRGRVQAQSLDRSSNIRDETNKPSTLKKSHHDILKGGDTDFAATSVEVYDTTTGGLTDSYKLDDTSMPSPIIEEASPATDASTKKDTASISHTTSVSSPLIGRRQRTISSSSIEHASSEKPTLHESMAKANRGQLSTSSSTSSSRRVSFDMSPTMSPTSEYFPIELFGKNIENSRQLRKAMTGAADKKVKIEFLRENWQRRKEILIQNRGFVSSDESSSASKPDSTVVSDLISEHATTPENGATKHENSTHNEIALASRGIGSPPLRSKFTSIRKTQINEKRYHGSPDSSRSPSTSSESPTVTRKSEIPASILAKELKNIEAFSTKREEVPRKLSSQTLYSNFSGKANTQEAGKEEDEEEEVTVIETETISIPMTTELLQDMKSPQKEVKIPSRAQSSLTTSTTHAGLPQTSSNKPDDEKEKETFIEETITVPLPSKTTTNKSSVYSLYSSRTTRPEQSSSTTTAMKQSTASVAESATETPKPTSTDSTSGSTTTTSTSLYNRSIPYTSTGRSSYYTSTGSTSSELTNTTTGDKTDAKNTTSTSDRTPSFFRRTSNENDAATSTKGATSSSLSSEIDKSQSNLSNTTRTPTTHTTTAASTLSTTTTNRMTSSSSSQPSNTTTTTTQTSTITSTTSSSYTRRYVPRTETIDVAALFSSFYKAPSSTASSTERDVKKNASEDNKENVGGRGTATSASRTQTRVETTSSNLLYNKTNTNNTSTKAESLTKTELKDDLSNSTAKNEIESNTTQPRYGSSFRRNYYTSPSTESRYAPQKPAMTDTEKVTEKEAPKYQTGSAASLTTSTTLRHSANSTSRQDADASSPSAITTTNSDQSDSTNTAASTESQTTTTTTTRKYSTNSLYSRYYSNPNALYSKPAEATTTTTTTTDTSTPKTLDNSQHPASSTSTGASQDQKVHETFTQAESARRVYEPQPSASSDQVHRRHTADIGKTIPQGIKISELYSKPTTNNDHNNVAGNNIAGGSVDSSKVSSQYRSPSIKESPAESTESEHASLQAQPETHGLYQPHSYYSAHGVSSNSTSRFSKADNSHPQLPRQQTLPDNLDFISTGNRDANLHGDEAQQTQAKTTPTQGGQKPMSSSYHPEIHHELSTASSPAGSPLMEDDDLFTQSVHFEDSSGAASSSSGSRSLKEIARKKRERWRRLTVY